MVHPPPLPGAANSDPLPGVLAWLADPPANDPQEDIEEFSRQLALLDGAPMDGPRYHRVLDLFFERGRRLSFALYRELADVGLPLARDQRRFVSALADILGRVAAGYERVLGALPDQMAHSVRRNPAIVAARGLSCLADQIAACWMSGAPAPADSWCRAHRLARQARKQPDLESTVIPGIRLDAERIYKSLLALAVAQPEGFAPGELSLAREYLAQFSGAVDLGGPASEVSHEGAHWIDLDQDRGPTPPNRRIPPEHGELLFCSCERLGRLLGEQIAALEGGMAAGTLRIPERSAERTGRATLKRLQAQWSNVPQRRHLRRPSDARAQLCVGLDELWQMLETGAPPPPGITSGPSHATEWLVRNEGPGGLAVMHIAGEVSGLVPGTPVAVRTTNDEPWNICVVRWIRCDNPEHLELGLERLAPAARSVQVFFRNGETDQRPTPGLLLPPIPALREHPAIMAPSGIHAARRFFIVAGQDRTQVMQGRMLSTDVQTRAVELFQFEPDPFPR